MAASNVKPAFGTLFKKGGTAVTEVVDIDGPSISRGAIDVTHQQSPNRHMEFIPDITDPGEVSFEVNFLPDDTTQKEILSDISSITVGSYSLTWIDGSKVWTFSAFPTKFQPKAAVKAKQLTASVTFKLTGAIDFGS